MSGRRSIRKLHAGFVAAWEVLEAAGLAEPLGSAECHRVHLEWEIANRPRGVYGAVWLLLRCNAAVRLAAQRRRGNTENKPAATGAALVAWAEAEADSSYDDIREVMEDDSPPARPPIPDEGRLVLTQTCNELEENQLSWRVTCGTCGRQVTFETEDTVNSDFIAGELERLGWGWARDRDRFVWVCPRCPVIV